MTTPTEPLSVPEPSQQALDAATIAGRKVYARDSPLNHSPAVIRMLDDAVDAAVRAALPALAAQTLESTAEITKTHYIIDSAKGKYTRIPHEVYVFNKEVRTRLRDRAAAINPTNPEEEEDFDV